MNEMSGSGCKTCPVKDCDAQYRGSQCAALRAKAGADSDPMTNADRIRGMSDEELAEFIPNWSYAACKYDGDIFCNHECGDCVRDWLQQPAQEEEQI